MKREGYLGKHYETGTLANLLGVSESLVFGMSGGAAIGYFIFEYKGHLPHLALLTRNTFDPFARALDNLGVRREERQTTDPDRAEKLLREELDAGQPVVVWADMFSLTHHDLDPSAMWAMVPLLVVGHEPEAFWVVDGTSSAFLMPASELREARARVKKDRNRWMTVQGVDRERWAEGCVAALRTCVALYLDKPPAGAAENFGLAALEQLEAMLSGERNKRSWARVFAEPKAFHQAVFGRHGQPGLFTWIETWGTAAGADRATFAAFLREAAQLCGLQQLAAAASKYEACAPLWSALAESVAPPEAIQAKREASRLWFEHGPAALPEIRALRKRLAEIAETATYDQPAARTTLAEGIRAIRAAESEAIQALAATPGLRG